MQPPYLRYFRASLLVFPLNHPIGLLIEGELERLLWSNRQAWRGCARGCCARCPCRTGPGRDKKADAVGYPFGSSPCLNCLGIGHHIDLLIQVIRKVLQATVCFMLSGCRASRQQKHTQQQEKNPFGCVGCIWWVREPHRRQPLSSTR